MYGAPYDSLDLTIAASGTTSNAVPIDHYTWFALKFPGAITGATIAFEASDDGENFYDIVNEDGSVSITPPGSEVIMVLNYASPNLAPFRWVRIVSASAEAAARSFTLFCKHGPVFGEGAGAPPA